MGRGWECVCVVVVEADVEDAAVCVPVALCAAAAAVGDAVVVTEAAVCPLADD